jgi:primosomal protein N' (replication factor Y)
MFVDIITQAPKTLTYSVPTPLRSKIKVGQIVAVPLGNKKISGVVFKVSSQTNYPKVRPIEKILTSNPLFFDYQIELAKWIANYYCAPIYKAMNLMLPPKLPNDQSLLPFKKNISNASVKKPIFLWASNQKEKEKFYLAKIKKCISNNKQALLLYPKISLNHSFINYLLSGNPQKVTLFSSLEKPSQLQEEWQKIRENTRKLIIGSQKPIFFPFPQLDLIIVDEEQDDLYKQERVPHYHVSRVAQKLAELTGAQLILSTNTPSISSYYNCQKRKYHLVKLSDSNLKQKRGILVDLNKLPYMTRIISPTLKEKINQTLASKKQIILFLNRKGMARSIVCPDCGQTLNCPSCDLPLIYYQASQPYLWCSHCNKKNEVPDTCPKCLSLFITEKGIGIATIKKELEKSYPLANIVLLDKEIAKKELEKILTDFLSKKIDILVGTQIILGYSELESEALGIISADSELARPDFESERKTYSLLTSLIRMSKGKTIVQAYNPDLPCIKYALTNSFFKFYQTELDKRKVFSQPPFVQLIKLTHRNRNNKKAYENAKALFEKIKENNNQHINIIGPSPCFIHKKKGLYFWQIIIKLKLRNDNLSKEQTDFKKELINFIDNSWSIDVNPKTLIS